MKRPMKFTLLALIMSLSVVSLGLVTSVKADPLAEAMAAYEARDRISAKMTPEQITEAQRLALEWKPKP